MKVSCHIKRGLLIISKEYLCHKLVYQLRSVAWCLINVVYLTTLYFLNNVANDAESTQNIDRYVIFASLESESTWFADE